MLSQLQQVFSCQLVPQDDASWIHAEVHEAPVEVVAATDWISPHQHKLHWVLVPIVTAPRAADDDLEQVDNVGSVWLQSMCKSAGM